PLIAHVEVGIAGLHVLLSTTILRELPDARGCRNFDGERTATLDFHCDGLLVDCREISQREDEERREEEE
ncbi:hypothetical protein PMAYCL1PPCAC_07092, partial [Pristionchus mayeri]